MNEWLAESWVIVTMIFIVGTLAASFAAARPWPARPYQAAVLGGLAFEALLLLVIRPGLSTTAVMIAATLTTLIALVGGLLGRRVRART